MSENIFDVNHATNVNLANGEVTSNVYVRVYNSMFISGLVAKMGANSFTTLMALASFMDEKGECYPTQLQLAERIGVHKNTINKYINELLELRVDEKPLVTRTKVNRGQGNISSFYKIHPLSQLAKFNGEIENLNHKLNPKNEDSLITSKGTNGCDVIRSNNNQLNNNQDNKDKPLSAKDLLGVFINTYRETYNVNYVVSNYGREMKLLKDKVLVPHPDLAKEIIELGVTQYEQRFKNPKFPRPTISMFSWAVNQLVDVIEEEKEITVAAESSAELEAIAEQEQLDKLARLG